MEKSKTFRNLFAIIKWECYNKQTCRVEIDSAVILVLKVFVRNFKLQLYQLIKIRVSNKKILNNNIVACMKIRNSHLFILSLNYYKYSHNI